MLFRLLLVIGCLPLACCGQQQPAVQWDELATQVENVPKEIMAQWDTVPFAPLYEPVEFSRDSISQVIRAKVLHKEPLYVHVLTPLCDNDHQGIVPVAQHLGRGRDLRGNLYWGCGHGMKAYFKKQPGWRTIRDLSVPGDSVLERSIFRKTFPNGAVVYLISDAYAGDHMDACLNNYFGFLSGALKDTVHVDGHVLQLGGNANLIGFNGHNGLMDTWQPLAWNKDGRRRDAVAIACYSDVYFEEYLKHAGGYPLVLTTGLLYPGAFVFDDVVTQWVTTGTAAQCRIAAGEAYDRVMNCGRSAGIGLFTTGW